MASHLESSRVQINDCVIRAEREYFINTARTVTVVVSNYSACKVNFMVLRSNASSTFRYWNGYLNNNNNTGYDSPIETALGTTNTLSLTFYNDNNGTYRFVMNSSGSGAWWGIYLWTLNGSTPSVSSS